MIEPKKAERLSPKKVLDDVTNKLDKVVESTNVAIEATNERIEANNEASNERFEDLGSKMDKVLDAIQRPAIVRKSFEPMEQDLGENHVLEAKEVDGNSVIETPVHANPDSVEFQNKAAELAFMEEPVTVTVHATTEKNADKVIEISVNGKSRVFLRNIEYTVPRKYVEGLARAKPVNYENEEYTMSNGERGVRWPSHRGLRYPFAVVRDDNPRGKPWLQGILMQP